MVDSADDGEALERGTRRPNPVDVHVGNRVRLQRMLIGISQEKLGERLGLTFQQVQKYEKGINRIGASRLYDLAQVLGVPVQFFYEEAPIAEARANGPDGQADGPDEHSIVAFLRSRDDERFAIAEAGAITFSTHLVLRSPLLRELSRRPRIVGICADLVDPDVNLYWDQAVYKRPEKPRRFPWHQDNGYAFVEPQQYLTM